MRQLTLLHKRSGSGDQGCPAAYAVGDNEELVIQGYRTDDPAIVRVEMDVISQLGADHQAAIAHAVTAVDPGYQLVSGAPITDPGELDQLRSSRAMRPPSRSGSDSGQVCSALTTSSGSNR